jgi:hypothetical protein
MSLLRGRSLFRLLEGRVTETRQQGQGDDGDPRSPFGSEVESVGGDDGKQRVGVKSLRPLFLSVWPGNQREVNRLREMRERISNELSEVIDAKH